jgi:zinc transporter, ZIP family
VGEAFIWGLVAGTSLVVGGVIALRFSMSRRALGLIMAFGAGVLISAVAYELVHEAFETSAGEGRIALGLLSGSLVFFGAEVAIDRLGARREQSFSAGTRAAHAGRGHHSRLRARFRDQFAVIAAS